MGLMIGIGMAVFVAITFGGAAVTLWVICRELDRIEQLELARDEL